MKLNLFNKLVLQAVLPRAKTAGEIIDTGKQHIFHQMRLEYHFSCPGV